MLWTVKSKTVTEDAGSLSYAVEVLDAAGEWHRLRVSGLEYGGLEVGRNYAVTLAALK